MMELESILDTPKEGLDSAVWKMSDDGRYELTDAAETVIGEIVDYERERFGMKNVSVRITGSITSNQYSDDSDIDIHISFDGLTEENSDDLNRVMRADFEENYKDSNTGGPYNIGNHPVEVYFQANPYQDLMSVGCYDFIQKMWLVGPDLKPVDFDPYSEFYSEDMEHVKDVIADIRNTILKCYETAVVIKNSSDGEFRNGEFRSLRETMKEAVDIFNSAKQCRKVYSSPKSVEDALRKRESRKWKIADSSFKLMDKFGYLKILKVFSTILDRIDDFTIDSIAEGIIGSVSGSMNLSESVDESLKNLGRFMVLSSFLYLPTVLPQEALAKSLSRIDKSELSIYSPAVQTAIQTASNDKTRYGKYSATDIINMVARTLYVEGHSEGMDGRKAILSVIKNRSDGKNVNIPAVLREKYAFSCWNNMTSSDWDNYLYRIPSSGYLSVVGNPRNRRIWSDCVNLSLLLFNGKFKSTIGNRNSYLNPNTAGSGALNSWGKKMDLTVGKHKFGYLREHDPKYVIPGTMTAKGKTAGKTPNTYIVKKNDTLGAIARANKMTLDELLAKNPQIKDRNKISIGQKIII